MRLVTAVLITCAVTSFALTAAGPARATVAFDGPQAAGVTAGAGLLTGMVCWTMELAAGEHGFGDDSGEEVERDDDFDRLGWYLGVEGVVGTPFMDDGEEDSLNAERGANAKINLKLDKHMGGFGVKAGRRCHSRLSVEIQVEWIDPIDARLVDDRDGVPSQGTLIRSTYAPIVGSVNMKGYLLTGRFQPYLLFGVGTLSLDVKSRDLFSPTNAKASKTSGGLALRFGTGIDIYATRNWVVTARTDYVYSATNIEFLDYFTAGFGVEYRF